MAAQQMNEMRRNDADEGTNAGIKKIKSCFLLTGFNFFRKVPRNGVEPLRPLRVTGF